MDLDTRPLAAFIGKIILRVRDILARARVERFEIHRGSPEIDRYPHWMALTEPLDHTSAALVESEVTKVLWFDSRHHHGGIPAFSASEKQPSEEVVYLAWTGSEYPGGVSGGHARVD
jgi:hypothetical protein